ncbi:hypothetical protein [Fusibacter sp. 3D3]|uniref:hypothetical protein n=1 Tax=Fusibacter sp. 3D3 TaxID=1048380 RepID=UPI000853844E|nr:hypothetical protein [Fusibacter sp. 3D3]GAU77718.1 hypothetical protein F3D3_2347 [Fusibacter sp. 3D3]
MDKRMLNELIGKMPKKSLIEMIEIMIRFNSAAEQELLDYCQNHALSENKNMINQKQIQKHWSKAYRIIDNSNTYGGCSEEDEETACDEMDAILNLVRENIASWECRKEVIDGMLEQIAFDNSGFTDMLVDSAMEICKDEIEKEYFADHLARIGGNYYKGFAASIFRSLGKEDKFLETQKANLIYGSDYLTLSKYYEKKGQKEQALKNAWEGLEKCQGRVDELCIYLFRMYKGDEPTLWKLYDIVKKKKRDLDTVTELLYDYFKKNNHYENQKNMLIELVQCCDKREVEKWYKKCKAELQPNDWNEYETLILRSVKDKSLSEYLKICLANNNKAEVLEILKKQSGFVGWHHLDEDHRFSKKLSKLYPDDIAELYWKEVKMSMNQQNEKGYRHAVSVLKEIQKIMRGNKQVDEWNRKYAELLMEHKKKRLFMKILDE